MLTFFRPGNWVGYDFRYTYNVVSKIIFETYGGTLIVLLNVEKILYSMINPIPTPGPGFPAKMSNHF